MRGGTSRSSARRDLRIDGRVRNAGGRREGGNDESVVLSKARVESYDVHDESRRTFAAIEAQHGSGINEIKSNERGN
jgi:hypothetical protein